MKETEKSIHCRQTVVNGSLLYTCRRFHHLHQQKQFTATQVVREIANTTARETASRWHCEQNCTSKLEGIVLQDFTNIYHKN